MRLLFSIIYVSISFAQNLQVHVVEKISMDLPVLGPFTITNIKTVAPGFFRSEETIDAKRFYSSWFMDGTTGEIMISGTEKIIMYDRHDEQYWLQSKENYFANPDTSSEKPVSYSFSFSKDDEESPPKVTRTGGKVVELLNGFQTKKWITTLSYETNKIIFEEWYVDKLPLMLLSDSLESAIKTEFHPSGERLELEQIYISSNLFLKQSDSLTTLKPIPGFVVKINFLIYEENDKLKSTLGYEMVELYAESVDTSFFTIPESYERIEKE